jgi:ABC-type transport system substrate-binding protein
VLDFNVTGPILGQLAVRQAIDAAIDRRSLVNTHLGGIPDAENTLYPTLQDWERGPTPISGSRYDPQRATALLESAGWLQSEAPGVRYRGDTALRVRLLVNEQESNALAAARFVAVALGKVGFQVDLEALPGALISERLQSGNFDMHVSHTCSVAQLGCLGAKGKYTRFHGTAGLYSSPELERLMELALGSTRGPREASFAALWQHLDERAVGAPLFDVVKPMAHRADLKGFDFGSTVLTMNLTRARIEARPGSLCSRKGEGAPE